MVPKEFFKSAAAKVFSVPTAQSLESESVKQAWIRVLKVLSRRDAHFTEQARGKRRSFTQYVSAG